MNKYNKIAEDVALRSYDDGHEVRRLRLLFLTPLAIATICVITTLILTIYVREQQSVDETVIRIRATAENFYEESIRYDASALRSVMDIIQRDQILKEALANRDRKKLLARSSVLFADLKRDFSITHFYFTGTDRVNLLRVHAPSRYGDLINRMTTLAAEKSGSTAFGVELGPLGTFTLRLVTPWYDDNTHELIGYVELGMEIDQVLQKLRNLFRVEVFLVVHKDQLDRNNWENGMRTMGHTIDWDRFPDVVLGSQTSQAIPSILAERLTAGDWKHENMLHAETRDGITYRIAFLPLDDAGGEHVADMILMTNITQERKSALTAVYAGSGAALVAGIFLLVFFNWQVCRIGSRIESDSQTLKQLTLRDGLTSLYNHRGFYDFLNEETIRAQRYEHSVAILMIDVDHFKNVNDQYGHPAGDAILRELGLRLTHQARKIDRVCRYGGEEIAIILPGTKNAFEAGERLRKAVEATAFDIGNGKSIFITVSIGGASLSETNNTPELLVAAADAALYKAKESGRNKTCI